MQTNNSTDSNKELPVPDRFHNGWLDGLDGRLGIAKELRLRFETLTGDLGGSESLSYAERSLCERGIWLEYWLSQQEAALAKGDAFDVGKWTQACNALQGLYSKLGLKRIAKDVPSLAEYVRQNYGAEAREQAEAST